MATEDQNIKIIFDTNAAKAAQDVNKLSGSIDSATSASNENNQAVNQSDEAYKSFKTQLREANEELQKQIQLTGESSQETIKAAKAVADLKDQMGFAKDLADNFNPDQKMKALGAATQVAGTGLQGVTAGMALFGSESEDTQKQLLKVQAAMAFSDAISNLSNLGDQWKLLKNTIAANSLVTKAYTAATGAAAIVQNVFTGSVNTSSAGFKALRLAIAGTGIGLLVVALAAVVVNFEKISKWANSFGWLRTIAQGIKGIAQGITDFVGVTSEADRAIDKMKSNAEKRSKEIDRILKEDGSRYSESAKKKMAIDKQLQDDLAEGLYNEKKLRREAAFAKAQIDKENRENEIKKAKEHADKLAYEAKKRKEQREQAEKEEADRLQKLADEKLAAEMKSAQDALNIIEDLKKSVETPAQKEQREYEEKKLILEKNNVSTEELTRQHLEKLAEIKKTDDEKEAEEKRTRDEKALEDQKNLSEKEIQIEKDKANQKQAIEDSQLKAADSAVGFLQAIAGKNKFLQKTAIIAESALGIGKSIIANNTANVGALATPQAIATSGAAAAPVIAFNNISTGLGIAANIAATTKALQALGGGGGASSGSAVGGTRSAAPPSVAFNNSAENQIGQSVARTQAEQPPLKVTVLESDITKAQNNVNVLVNKNKF